MCLSATPAGALTTKDITITTLQTFLESKGLLVIPKGDIKGNFGPLTKKSLIAYQASVGLPAQGIFGPQTKATIAAELSGVSPAGVGTTTQVSGNQTATSSTALSPATTTSQTDQPVTEASLNARLQAIYREIALSQHIDQLSNTHITGGSISGASISGTSISGLSTDSVGEGNNLYYTDGRADARLSATSSLPNITTLSGLTSIGTSGTATTFKGNVAVGTTIPVSQVGSYGDVAAWGDSLTSGAGGTPYPTQLTALAGANTFNGGVGGETSTQIKTRMVADSLHKNWFTVIWVGRNNLTDTSTVLADIAAMVAALPSPKRFLVLSVLNYSIPTEILGGANYHYFSDLSTALATTYPSNFLDIRALLVAAYNPVVPQDVIDHANDVPPSSLQPTDVHLNTAGYLFVAQKVNAWLQANAWATVPTFGAINQYMAANPPLAVSSMAFLDNAGARQTLNFNGANQLQLSASWVPTSNGSYDLGHVTNRWRVGYFDNAVHAKLFQLEPAISTAILSGICNATFVGSRWLVNDATSATPGSTLVGGGTYTIAVQCIYNSAGSAYSWIID